MKGQSGINTGIVIILVMISIVIYILLLPPEVRDELLNDGTSSVTPGTRGDIVLDVTPGRIDQTTMRDRVHTVPSFRIQVTEQAEVLKSIGSLHVENGAFSKEAKSVEFEIDEDATDSMILSFNVDKADGRLIILHNNQEILNEELSKGSISPIQLDIGDDDNELVFFVNSPGFWFFMKNEYDISDIQVTGKVKDLSSSSAANSFSLTTQEYETLDTASLRYRPNCNPRTTGQMTIWINGIPIFEGKADCGFTGSIDLDPEMLDRGSNTLEFSSGMGSYIIDNIEVRTSTSSELGSDVYFFSLSDKYFDGSNLDNDFDVFLEITFTDDDSTKRADIEVNGESFSLRTTDDKYTRRIDSFVERGTNTLEIDPDGRLDIARLRVSVD